MMKIKLLTVNTCWARELSRYLVNTSYNILRFIEDEAHTELILYLDNPDQYIFIDDFLPILYGTSGCRIYFGEYIPSSISLVPALTINPPNMIDMVNRYTDIETVEEVTQILEKFKSELQLYQHTKKEEE